MLWHVFHNEIDSLNLLVNSPSQMIFLVPTSIILLPQTSFIRDVQESPGLMGWGIPVIYPWLSSNKQILNDIDCRYALFFIICFFALIKCSNNRIAVSPLFSGLCRFPQGHGFKQWTGDDSKALIKVYINSFSKRLRLIDGYVYLPAIEGYVPCEILHTFHAFWSSAILFGRISSARKHF